MHSLALYVDGRCRKMSCNASSAPGAGNGKGQESQRNIFAGICYYISISVNPQLQLVA